MSLCAWRRSALAKKVTLSGNAMTGMIVSHTPTGRSTSVVFVAVPRRRIVIKFSFTINVF